MVTQAQDPVCSTPHDNQGLSEHSRCENNYMLIAYVEYLIYKIYVGIGNRVYRQCIGIPMGTDFAPLVANLFLFHYEYKYIYEKFD